MKLYYSILFSLLISQCSAPEAKRDQQPASPPSEEDPGVGLTDIPLVELPAQGSQLRFLDAIALTDVYSRVFIKGENGRWKGCGNEDQWCQKSMFSKAEAKFLGTFSLLDGVDSFRVKKDFTLNYTRNLRAMLYRECRNLVDIEWDRDVKSNSLVFRKGLPEIAELDQFSRRLFGLTGTSFPIDNMATEYRAAFASSVTAKSDANAMKSGFVVVCMALAMDPAIFLY